MSANKKEKVYNPVLAENRRARHDYSILEAMEAGIKLVGTEVKSCRARQIMMNDAYVDVLKGEAFLENVNIAQYSFGNRFNHVAKQRRRLLLHRNQIQKLQQQVREKGLTIVPLKFYLKGGLVKVEIALCRGKNFGDKRETLRDREVQMETRRAIANFK